MYVEFNTVINGIVEPFKKSPEENRVSSKSECQTPCWPAMPLGKLEKMTNGENFEAERHVMKLVTFVVEKNTIWEGLLFSDKRYK